MGGASYLVTRSVRHRRCNMAASFLDMGKVKVAPNYESRHHNLGQAVEDGWDIYVRSARRSVECDAVHVEE